jgi:hypothetical protein
MKTLTQSLTSCGALFLLLALLLPGRLPAQPVSLPATWGAYDLQENQGVSPTGLLSLTAQSSSGFTATVASNGYAPAYPSRSQYLPRVYALFAPQPITNLGQRVTVSFDIQFKTVVDPSNVGSFRFTLGDTNANNGLLGAITIGSGTGTLNRYDIALTQDTNLIDLVNGYYLFAQPTTEPTNISMGSVCDGGANLSSTYSGGMPPNGVQLGVDTTTIHHIRYSVERTVVGGNPALQSTLVWGNNAGTDVFENAGAPLLGGNGDDHSSAINVLPWTSVNLLGFCLFGTGGNQHFFGYDPGTYTLSNLKVYSGFPITSIERNPTDGGVTLKWESTKVDICQYEVQRSTNLTSWEVLATVPATGYESSYVDYPSLPVPHYYRVNKVFP